MSDLELGEVYEPDELPENQVLSSGKLEQWDKDTFVLVIDGVTYEFEQLFRCKAVAEQDERGEHYYREHLYEPVHGDDE